MTKTQVKFQKIGIKLYEELRPQGTYFYKGTDDVRPILNMGPIYKGP